MLEYSADQVWPINYNELDSYIEDLVENTKAYTETIGETYFGGERRAVVFPGGSEEMVISAGEDPDELIPVARMPDILEEISEADISAEVTVVPFVEKFMPAEVLLETEHNIVGYHHIKEAVSDSTIRLEDEVENLEEIYESEYSSEIFELEEILWDPVNQLLAMDGRGSYEFYDRIIDSIKGELPQEFWIYLPATLENSVRPKALDGREYGNKANHGDEAYKERVEKSDFFLNFHQGPEGFVVADPNDQEMAQDIVTRIQKLGEPLADEESLRSSGAFERVNGNSVDEGIIYRDPETISSGQKITWESPDHFFNESPLAVVETLLEHKTDSDLSE